MSRNLLELKAFLYWGVFVKKTGKIVCCCICFLFACAVASGIVVLFADTEDVPQIPQRPSADNEEVDYSQLTYCAFGDSITYGANFLDSYNAMENPYPTLVANTLGLKSYRNAGVSGATFVANVSNRACVADIVKNEKASYDIISVMAGVNDFSVSTPLGKLGDTSADSIYGSLDLIAKTLKANNPDAFIFFMTLYQSGHNGSCMNNNSVGYNLLDVANAIKNVAAVYNIPVLDMFLDGKYEIYGMNVTPSDKLHPNQEFVTMYTAPQIVRFIKTNYPGKAA